MYALLELAMNKGNRDTESQLQPVMEKMLVKLGQFNKCIDFVNLIEY